MKTLRNILTSLCSSLPKAAAGCLAALCLVLTAACERRPLEDPVNETRIRIEVNTRGILNVTAGIYNDKIPEPTFPIDVMHVKFFDPVSNKVVNEAYISEKEDVRTGSRVFSGKLQINPGSYRLMIHNFGIETTVIKESDHWSNATALSIPVNNRILNTYKEFKMKSGEEEPTDNVVYDPDHLMLYVNGNEYIPYHEGDYVIETEATTIIDTYYLQIMVEGLEYVSSATAYLSGMASGNKLSERSPVNDPECTVFFNLVKSDDKGVPVICNLFNTFGHIPDSNNELEIVFDLQTKDGNTQQHYFNITEVFKTKEAIENHWLLIKDTIKVEPPENPNPEGGGLDPSVEDWEEENHEIIL